MFESNLAGELYPKEIDIIKKVVDDTYMKDKFNEEDIATLTR